MLCYGVQMFLFKQRENCYWTPHVWKTCKQVQSGPWMRWGAIKKQSLYLLRVKVFDFVLPFPAFETSSWTVEMSVFFFFVTAAPFLSKVIGLYCGRLLNFLSNSSSNFPRLTSEVQSLYSWAYNHIKDTPITAVLLSGAS